MLAPICAIAITRTRTQSLDRVPYQRSTPRYRLPPLPLTPLLYFEVRCNWPKGPRGSYAYTIGTAYIDEYDNTSTKQKLALYSGFEEGVLHYHEHVVNVFAYALGSEDGTRVWRVSIQLEADQIWDCALPGSALNASYALKLPIDYFTPGASLST